MKSTLIFLILFCVATISYPKTAVLTEDPFENTTGISFNEDERLHLLLGGTITTRSQIKMEGLLLPKFVKEYNEIFLVDGKTNMLPKKTSLPELGLLFFISCLVCPCWAIFLVSIRLPQNQNKALTIFYLTFSVGTIIFTFFDFNCMVGSVPFGFVIIGLVSVVVGLASLTKSFGGFDAFVIGIVFFGASLITLMISSGDESIEFPQFFLFLGYSILVFFISLMSFIIRQHLRKEEEQKSLQNLN